MSLSHRAGVTGIVPEHWAQMFQVPLRKSLVSAKVANSRFEPVLRDGDTIHWSYYDELSVQDYTPNTDIDNAQLITANDETLTVDQSRVVPIYVDNIEQLQSRPSQMQAMIEDASFQIRNDIDTKVLLNVTGAASSLDAGDIGGTSGSAITAASGNVIDIFASAREKLRRMDVEETGDWIVISNAKLLQQIEIKAANTGFNVSDSTLRNGFVGDWMGFKWYLSNNLPTETYGGTEDTANVYIGRASQIDLVTQIAPNVVVKGAEKRFGDYVYVHSLFGTGLFEKSKHRFLSAKIK